MPSALPSENAWSKAVKDFGIGPYDGASDDTTPKGEDDERREPEGKSLPDGGAPDDRPIEYYLGYPQEEAMGWKHSSDIASGMLPGDLDTNRPQRTDKPDSGTKDDVVPTSGPPADSGHAVSDEETKTYPDHSQLPTGKLPAARSDYYDRTLYGASIDQIWPSEDSGAYAGESHEHQDDEDDEGETGASGLPTPGKADVTMGDFLESFGNANQGFVWEDTSDAIGFPSQEFKENVDFPKSNDDTLGQLVASFGTSIAGRDSGEHMTERTATDVKLVTELTKDFLKKFGKKNIVRRHVLAFLQDKQLPQYLASDIVRCLKHQHKVVIPDVMDTFPLGHIAGEGKSGLGAAHRGITELWLRHSDDPATSAALRRCASRLGDVLAELDRSEVGYG